MAETKNRRQLAYALDRQRREIVLRALLDVCVYRGWYLWAAHVRKSHVHVVVSLPLKPEKALVDFKVYASRELNRAGVDHPNRSRWDRHGSTRYLWTSEQVQRAIHYVLSEQGAPLAIYPEA